MKHVFLSLCTLLLLGCSRQEAMEVPRDLLSERKMINILVDVHVAETQVEQHFPSPDTAMRVYKGLEQEIFKKHRVEEKAFRDSYDYYKQNIQLFDRIYERVIDSLTMLEVKAQAAAPPPAPPAPAPDTAARTADTTAAKPDTAATAPRFRKPFRKR